MKLKITANALLPSLILITLLAGILRFFILDINPPGLYIDEVSIGQNAYAILTTGRDEHGKPFPLWFQAFGEYKLPVYVYITSLAMVVFGKTDLAVRAASAFFGTVTIPLLFFLVRDSIERSQLPRWSKGVPILAAFFLAVSPWHIHFSRGGFEVTVGIFFYLLSCYLFLRSVKNKSSVYMFLAVLVAVIPLYTYNAFRIITPITVLGAFIIAFRLKYTTQYVLLTAGTFLFLFFPLLMFSLSDDGKNRFSQTTFTADYQLTEVTEKVVVYPQAYLKNYLSYFSIDYFFNTGDLNGRHQVPGMGLFYRWQILFLIAGIYALLRTKNTLLISLLIFLLVVVPIPAALARPSPHSLRSLLLIIPLIVIISLGVLYLWEMLRKKSKLLLLIILIGIAAFEFSYYVHYYYIHYPRVNLADWGGGYKELSRSVAERKDTYDVIIVDSKLPDTKLYFSFYNPEIHVDEYVTSSWNKPDAWKEKKVLYIRPNYGSTNKQIIHTVLLPNLNNDVFAELWEL